MAKDRTETTIGKDSTRSAMGLKQRPEEDMRTERGEQRYAGPERAIRGPRKDRPVAVIGASADRAKFGNKAVRAYSADGYTVWPVNPKGGSIEGVDTYRSVDELPEVPFAASIYLHEDAAIETLEALADMQQREGQEVGVIYLNPGSDTAPVTQRAEELGLYAVNTCSIQAIGHLPSEFGE